MRRLVLALAVVLGMAQPAAAAPDILAILLDDMGAGEIGPDAHGSVSPNIDALAARGTVFTEAYAPAPMCGPSRVGTFSMRQPQELGAYRNSPDADVAPVATFATLLRHQGYETYLVGKWHPWEQSPLDLGFDHFYGFIGGEHDYRSGTLVRDRRSVPWSAYLTRDFTDEGVGLLRSGGSKPRLIVMSYSAPHTPMQAPPGSGCDAGNTRCIWLAMVRDLDDGIGRLVAAAGNDTLIVLAGDNGCDTADSTCKAPLRGKKNQLYEGGVRVPFMMVWPGRVPSGRSGKLVSTLDWGPTFLAAAGAPVPAWADGRNLLAGGSSECLFWALPTLRAARCGKWKLVGGQLFDLERDPRESTDVAGANPQPLATVQGKLRTAASTWIAPRY